MVWIIAGRRDLKYSRRSDQSVSEGLGMRAIFLGIKRSFTEPEGPLFHDVANVPTAFQHEPYSIIFKPF
jgi:hypothetical protein